MYESRADQKCETNPRSKVHTVWIGIAVATRAGRISVVRNTNAQSGGNKLRLCGHFNKSFKLHRYLTSKTTFIEKLSVAHSLMCEIGRYCNIPYKQRLCRLYEMNKVDSEHRLFECSCYSDLRNQLPNQLTKDRDRHPVRHMYSLLSSSDPGVQTQLPRPIGNVSFQSSRKT